MRSLKRCFRDPITEIFDAARYLDAAVSAHLQGEHEVASKLFSLANNQKVRSWLESIWGKGSPYVTIRKLSPVEPPSRVDARMPTAAQIAELHSIVVSVVSQLSELRREKQLYDYILMLLLGGVQILRNTQHFKRSGHSMITLCRTLVAAQTS